MKYVCMFFKFTWDSLVRGYLRGLFSKTEIIEYTNPLCRKMVCVSRRWMGKEIEGAVYELNKIDPERIKIEKKLLSRIQEVLMKYEEEHGEIVIDGSMKQETSTSSHA